MGTRSPVFAREPTAHSDTSARRLAGQLLGEKTARITALFASDEHVQVEATWGIYQRMITARRKPDRARGRVLMAALIESVSPGVPATLTEITTI